MRETWNLEGWDAPFAERDLIEYVGAWYIIGENPNGSLCDITDQDKDQFWAIEKVKARKIIEAHDKFREAIGDILNSP